MKKLLLLLCITSLFTVQAQCWEKISAGGGHTLAIKNDGTLWGWGHNGYGQVGDGTNENAYAPVQIGTDTDWQSVSAGGQSSAAIKNNGTLWTWGDNEYHQLGDGTTTDSTMPHQMGTATNWASVSCGMVHVLALKNNGTLWAWGDNSSGQLGNGNGNETTAIVQVTTAANWQFIDAGYMHNSAIRTDGTLWVWGRNQDNQMGSGFPAGGYLATPSRFGTDANWQSVSGGAESTVAIKTDGTLWGWGTNTNGQLGNGTHSYRGVATQSGTDNNWLAVSSGIGTFTLGLKQDGSVWGWGSNGYGQVGDGTNQSRSVPTRILSDETYQFIDAGGYYATAITRSDNVYTWGENNAGGLGNEPLPDGPGPNIVSCGTTAGLGTPSAQSIVLYPNPVKDILYIDAKGVAINTILITDVTGKTIMSQNNTSQIELQQLPAGMYFVKIISRQNSYQDKFIKQ